MLDLGSDRENDTEAYRERNLTSIWCLCGIARDQSRQTVVRNVEARMNDGQCFT